MTPKLSDDIKAALAEYYMHRRLAAHGHSWDKARDIAQVVEVSGYSGWTVEPVAGTFWFTRDTPLGEIHVRADEKNYLMGGRANTGGTVEPLGAITEITEALKKMGREAFSIEGERGVFEDERQ
jgi:hypothetical protein